MAEFAGFWGGGLLSLGVLLPAPPGCGWGWGMLSMLGLIEGPLFHWSIALSQEESSLRERKLKGELKLGSGDCRGGRSNLSRVTLCRP